MDYQSFTVEPQDEGVVLVTMSRPDKLNAMHVRFFEELLLVLGELDADDTARACVLTGSGRAFSAGGDIGTFAELTDLAAYRRHLRLVYDAFHAVERTVVPVIAAVNGIAYGGGTELTLAADLAVAATTARFGFKEVTVGLMPGYGIVRGPQIIGKRWTRRLAMTGEDIDAAQALTIGLVEEVVEPERLVPRALEIAAAIAAHDGVAVRAAKAFINRDQGAPGLAESVEATALLFTTDAHRRRVEEFLGGARPAKDTLGDA